MRLIAIQPSSIVAGTSMMGELEKRMTALLTEARLDGILLFIDEVHAIIGAGGSAGRSDIASQLKPSLARGDFPCIAATTDEEFRRYIEADGALERRFQPVRVQELSPEATLLVVKALRDSLGELRNVKVPDSVLEWLVEFAETNLKNRYFPDKAVDLLEQCVAHAVANGKSEAGLDVAELVARRLAGLPISPEERLEALSKILTVRNLLVPDDLENLMARLQVTVRGLDLRPNRPNAVVLCAGPCAETAPALSSAIAEGLFGGPERVVAIDFARFTHNTDITLLLGAPPAYVGYNEDLPVHRFLQMPWSVFLCENVDACHPSIVRVLAEALGSGFFTISTGRRIYLSDAVVVCSAPGIEASGASSRAIGFGSAVLQEDGGESNMARISEEALGYEFASNCDLVLFRSPADADLDANLETARRLLSEITLRYRSRGVDINWQEGVAGWLSGKALGAMNAAAWERLIDRYVAPALVTHIPRPKEARGVKLFVTVTQQTLHVDTAAAEPAGETQEKNERSS
jgi:ATP-dependent Clp protease ATP-binding subunit ClpC